MLIGLVLTVPASRYFFRRRGPAVAVSFAAVFWAVVVVAALVLNRGHMSWGSAAISAASALVGVGYPVYLAVRRKDLREAAAEECEEAAAGPALRRCPGCGLNVDGATEKCPVCGAKADGEPV